MTPVFDQTTRLEDGAVARIDFAHRNEKRILVYGWVLDFANSVDKAFIYLGNTVVDLAKEAVRVRRPDVTNHFSTGTGSDEHGFYALVDLPSDVGEFGRLRLSITLSSGKTTESHWPISYDNDVSSSALQPYAATLSALLRQLSKQEAKRLIWFAGSALRLEVGTIALDPIPPPVRFEIDLCCVLENRLLVLIGWLFDPMGEVILALLQFRGTELNILRDSVRTPRRDIDADPLLYRKCDTLPGFILIKTIPSKRAESEEARFAITAGAETAYLARSVSHIPQETRREFLSLLSSRDPDLGLALAECMATLLDSLPEPGTLDTLLESVRHSAVERLPPSIHHAAPRYILHVDQATLVPGNGVFLVGWFNAEPSASLKVVCHCGSFGFAVSDNWIRYRRLDVSSHLANVGIMVSSHDHGYCCFVPLSQGDEPYYLSVVSQAGEVRRMRVTALEQGTLQTVRALLIPFDCGKADLRNLMERHIGPAVSAAWAARTKRSQAPVVSSYGPRPASPSVSIIVPLYGRHDFAEYQMALFADDLEFQSTELIYVVDDPAIVKEFYARCADLYGIYQVPFLVTHSTSNLGFAGINNFAAEIARGKYLLLMNSDVMPKRTRWLGDLVQIYESLPLPGLLGVKLLYEDGTVQHAGMAFRRLAAWSNLWTNHHPSKGLSPAGLSGVHEVPAVTAACAFIEAALYRQLGGFSEDYIIGDFEDSDLCLRASLEGRQNYVALDIELYHLERQSQDHLGDVQWRTNITVYNCLLHNGRWADLIEKTSAVEAEVDA